MSHKVIISPVAQTVRGINAQACLSMCVIATVCCTRVTRK